MFATLDQGKKFKNIQKKYNNLIKNKNYQLISTGKLNIVNNLQSLKCSNLAEGMTSTLNIPRTVEQVNEIELNKLKSLESKFNSKVTEYARNYKLYLEELVSRNSSLNTAHKNKVMKYNNSYYWINNAGTARSFDAVTWSKKDDSCPDSAGTMTASDFALLNRGPPMGEGELCSSGGYSAKDGGSGSTAWVDNQGYKHPYRDFINKHSSCPNDTRILTSIQYHAIPTRGSYDKDDVCATVSLDSPLHDKLVSLNNELMAIIKEFHSLISTLQVKDKELKKQISSQKNVLVTKYSALQKEKKRVMK